MALHNSNKKIGSVYKGNIKIGQIYKGSQLVYQSAFNITYKVDTSTTYTEKVVPNTTMISPKTFTPKKSGWTFVGWRKDTSATSSVLTTADAKATGHTTLYAVFKQTITCKFISNGTQNVSGTRYYNNGTTVNASITVPNGAGLSGWTWRGWSAAGSTGASAAVAYANGAKINNLTTGYTYYGLYYRTRSVATSWSCGWCGHTFSSKPSNCDLAQNDSHPDTPKINVASTKHVTDYYSGSGASS